MKNLCFAVAALALTATGALAQGGSPYNSSGSQAGGPLAGQERRMGASGGTPSAEPMRSERPMMKKRSMKRKMMRHHRRSRM